MSIIIIWNRLYSNQPRAKAFSKRRIEHRIEHHYFRKRLFRRGFRITIVRYLFIYFFLSDILTFIFISLDPLDGMVKVGPRAAVDI